MLCQAAELAADTSGSLGHVSEAKTKDSDDWADFHVSNISCLQFKGQVISTSEHIYRTIETMH
jgi:hypothetical protein